MLRLLLDEHISPTIAVQLRAKRPEMEVLSLKEWGYLGVSDEVILRSAYEEGLTLVTYDLRTISPLLKSWSEAQACLSALLCMGQGCSKVLEGPGSVP